MKDKRESITESFGKSIVNNIKDVALDTAETVLDSLTEKGHLKELPIIKYAVTTYNIIDDIKGRFYLSKLQNFINSFNSGMATKEEVEIQRERFTGRNRDKELAYISIIIDRYLDIDKPAILAKLYLVYLDGGLSWDEFCSYSEVLDKLIKNDIKYLITYETYRTIDDIIPVELLRLTGSGLMVSYQNDSPFKTNTQEHLVVGSDAFQRVKSLKKEYIPELTMVRNL